MRDPFIHQDAENTNDDWVSTPIAIRTDKTFVVKDFFMVSDTEVSFLRGQRINRKAVSGNYTTAVVDFLVGVTSLGTAPNIGLPNPKIVAQGKVFIVKDEVGGAATTTITIASDGEKLIDGAATTTLTTNYQAKSFYTDGNNWFIF